MCKWFRLPSHQNASDSKCSLSIAVYLFMWLLKKRTTSKKGKFWVHELVWSWRRRHSGAGSAGMGRVPGGEVLQGTSPTKWHFPALKWVEGRAKTPGHAGENEQLLLQAALNEAAAHPSSDGGLVSEGPCHRPITQRCSSWITWFCVLSTNCSRSRAGLGEHRELLKKIVSQYPKILVLPSWKSSTSSLTVAGLEQSSEEGKGSLLVSKKCSFPSPLSNHCHTLSVFQQSHWVITQCSNSSKPG